jgi:hypothetical protein
METTKKSSHSRPVITQAENNTTLWIGHMKSDPNDHFGGQIFTCPSAGLLDNIQVYSASVHHPGELVLTLHEFDGAAKTWGPALGSSTLDVHKKDHAKWIRFDLPALELRQGSTYGFRLATQHNAMIGLGEAAAGNEHPFVGQEWKADSIDQQGHFFSYFSLTYKVELCA